MLDLSATHVLMMLLTMLIIIGGGIVSARKVRTAEGFSLNGRKTSASMAAGAIAGASIGGGSTIGTSQLAYTAGISAIWFTLGVGIGLTFLALFLVRPLRESGCETVSQILVRSYGRKTGPVAGVIASLGIFFSCLASVLPAVWMLAEMIRIPLWLSGFLVILLISGYIYFGGMKGAAVSGLLKTGILWSMLVLVGFSAWKGLREIPDPAAAFPGDFWFDIFGRGTASCLENVLSLIVGICCGQTYAQVMFASRDVRSARIGALAAALVSMPVGIPCVMAAMCMKAAHPEISPILALPAFVLEHMSPALAGITLGALMMSLISSVSGLTFGISTMMSRDVLPGLLRLKTDSQILRANRTCVVVVSTGVIIFALTHLDSQVLMWNFLSMSLRGSIFIPLLLALWGCRRMAPVWAIPAMLISAFFAAGADTLLHLSVPPLFVGFAASIVLVVLGMTAGDQVNRLILRTIARFNILVRKGIRRCTQSPQKL